MVLPTRVDTYMCVYVYIIFPCVLSNHECKIQCFLFPFFPVYLVLQVYGLIALRFMTTKVGRIGSLLYLTKSTFIIFAQMYRT